MNIDFRFGVRFAIRIGALSTLAALSLFTATAQITIDAGDIGTSLAPGSTMTSRVDTTTDSVDIGSLGATSWDFSALIQSMTVVSNGVDPDTTPFTANFPTATHGSRMVAGGGTIYTYYALGSDLLLQGMGVSGFFQSRIMRNPPELLYDLPMTLNSSWSTTLVESTIVTAPPITTTNTQVIDNEVDAYGSMTLPGGGVHAALRIRTDRRVTTGLATTRLISYTIMAENGATVNVSTADTNQAATGMIAVSSVSWNTPIVTDAPEEAGLPSAFALRQNFPNPFNPSTAIAFDLPRASDVRLTLYNALGEAVRTLEDREYGPGRHTVSVDLSGLPSGMYVYRMRAGTFSEARKMLLVR